MSLYFIIHKENIDDMTGCSGYLIDELKNAFPGIRIGRFYNNTYITVGCSIFIDFRCGTDPCKLAGIRPDFYYSDNDNVAEMIEQGTCKVGGKRLTNVDSVIAIIIQYLKFKQKAFDIIDVMEAEESSDKKYKIEIWVCGRVDETYERDNIEEVLQWYRVRWKHIYDCGGCVFSVYENNRELTFEEESAFGFYK